MLVAAVVPFAAVGAFAPLSAWLAALLFGVLGAVALIDAMAARAGTRPLELELPGVVRLSKNKPGVIPVQLRNPPARLSQLRLGLPLPHDIESEHETLDVALPGTVAASRIEWACTPRARGNYRIDHCYFEIASPLGLWAARGARDCSTELRVYPDLMRERNRLAALFLNRGSFGLHTQRQVGQGREFEKLRDYLPGDSYDEIHWKATAKRGRPVTKLYQLERTQEVYVIVDASRLSARSIGGEPVLDRFIRAALVLGLVAERQGDLFGLVAFSDRVHRFTRASTGKSHFNACRDTLYTLSSSIATPDFDELCSFVRLRLRRRALLLILTDLGDPVLAESFSRNVDLICRQHVILVSMIRRHGVMPVFAKPDAASDGDVYDALAGHMLWQNVREVERSLQRRGVGFAFVDDERLGSEMVAQYMNIKARQAL